LNTPIRIVDSVTQLDEADAGCIAVTGSHGGTSAARFAAAARPLLAVFNDAGGGLDDAGFAGLPWLEARGVAACTVSHLSARIGEAHSTLNDGIITRLNELAGALGVRQGQQCRSAVEVLSRSPRRPP
jgi:hypothetical protein